MNQLKAQAIPDSVRIDTVKIDSTVTDSTLSNLVEPEPNKPKSPEEIAPWRQSITQSMNFVTDDSLLRWQIWPNWGDFYAYRKEVLSFRQGTIGRIDAFQISGFNPYEQSVDLEGIDLSNPITGLVNYNYVPHHKIGNMYERKSSIYESDIELKKYYILKPISYLNYDEAKFNYRNLEFMVSQNFSERTNLELSFWDRRDGDNYPSNEVLGNQIVGRLYHYLNQNTQIRSIYLRNQFELEEPFGYQVNDPLAFSFDEFASSPNTSSADSKNSRRDFITGIYFRKDSLSQEHVGLEVSLQKNELNLTSSFDTLNWDLRTQKINAFKILGTRNLSLKLEGSGTFSNFKSKRNISKSNWNIFSVNSELDAKLTTNFQLSAVANISQRSDGYSDSELGGGVKLNVLERLAILINTTLFSRMPSIQELYWSGVNYSGNSELENETGISIYTEIETEIREGLTFGISTRIKQSKKDALLGNDSTFINSGDISVISGTIFGAFQNHRFELESSATMDAFNDVNPQSSASPLSYNEQKLWIRNNAFIKGYAFDRAAFVKLGLRTTLSPIIYGSKYFNTELQYWQPNSSEVDIPAFFRLDAELSARVRAIMVVMRWENALDGVGQLGYFEAATFPMPSRRLIVGIRAQFRN